MELIRKYFPELNEKQLNQFEALGPLYKEWNDKINVISRKDIDHLYLHHVLHSLVLAKYDPFTKSKSVLDAGTGGGFPGIPLAIMFPHIQFTLLDSTAKKIHVVNEVVKALDLPNVTAVHTRVEDHHGVYDVVTSRAVSTLTQLVAWTKHLVPSLHWIVLKGGDQRELRKELPPLYKMIFTPVREYFEEEYFEGKLVVEVKKG